MIFPLFRLGAMLGLPRNKDVVFGWMAAGFYAGLRLGQEFAGEVESLLSAHGAETREALRVLGILKQAAAGAKPTFEHVASHFAPLARYGLKHSNGQIAMPSCHSSNSS